MSKNIAISDEVYRELKREKGDRSFSEVIESALEDGLRITDVTGQKALGESTYDDIKSDIETLSDGTLSRIDDETL